MRKTVCAMVAAGAVSLGGGALASNPVDRAAGRPITPQQLVARALPPAANVAPTGEPDPRGARAPYEVRGFRSARFGMDQDEVKAAIARDFGMPADSVSTLVNANEGTTVLMVRTPLPPGPGLAVVSYILGATRHRLIHVNVVWTTGPEPTSAERQAIATAGLQLSGYFRKQTWPKAPLKVGLTHDGLLMFGAEDAAGASIDIEARAVVVVRTLGGKVETSHPTGPAFLKLSFAQDPAHPDVASIAKGSPASP